MHQCIVPGCTRLLSGWSRYCPTHKSRDRRHGHPQQRGITKAELAPYLRAVEARIAKNADSPVWAKIEGNWTVMVNHAMAELARYGAGEAFVGHERQAYQQIVRLAPLPPRDVVETALAVYLLAEDQPRRFQSDEAFRYQLVRRVRMLTEANRGTWWNASTNKVQFAYRELSPRATEFLGELLTMTFGLAGLHVARLERSQAQAKENEAEDLKSALQGLT
jgi:hypothetical protein